jgi:hypothetical protein
MVDRPAKTYGRTMPAAVPTQERPMHMDPTIVHTVADLRREAVLAEAASVRRTTPVSATRKPSGAGVMARSLLSPIAVAVSWLVDEFEPVPDVTRGPKMTPMP